MADKNTKPESIAAVIDPVAAAPVVDAFVQRCAQLAELWQCTPDEARRREEARLAAKKLKAAA